MTDNAVTTMIRASTWRILLAVLLVGCGAEPIGATDAGSSGSDASAGDAGPSNPVDAGAADAGPVDAGPVDAGPVDAGPVDAGPVDAGPVDGGPLDGGTIDGGTVDAGLIDAGQVDAGQVDAGPVGPTDAGLTGCSAEEALANKINASGGACGVSIPMPSSGCTACGDSSDLNILAGKQACVEAIGGCLPSDESTWFAHLNGCLSGPPALSAACAASLGAVDGGPSSSPDAGADAGPDADVDAGTDAGADAGTNAGQDAGTCIWFAPCVPADSCHAGQWICPSTGPECQDTGASLSNGTSCADGGFCSFGQCYACGAACTPPWSCSVMEMVCDPDGGSSCTATGQSLPDLTTCDDFAICLSGNCVGCQQDLECVPADPCHTGFVSSCSPPTCSDTMQPGNDGFACGAGGVCLAGTCAAGPYHLALLSGALPPTYIDAQLASAVELQLTDATGTPLPLATISIAAPPGGIATPLSATTNSNGEASFTLRLNRPVNAHLDFAATGPGGAQVALSIDALAPPTGDIFGIVDDSFAGGNGAPPGPGTTLESGNISALAVASDGTVYFADATNCLVRALSVDGVVSDLVGTSGTTSCGFAGDDGPALQAQIGGDPDWTSTGLALDEANGLLYYADTSNNRVRRVNLSTGLIVTYAGGGTATAAPWGDGSAATSATLAGPAWLGFGPDGNLYIADLGHDVARYVDASGIIHTLALPSALAGDGVASLAWDAVGSLFVSTEAGVFRVDTAGNAWAVAGTAGGSATQNGIPATQAAFDAPPLLAFDPGGNLFTLDYSAGTVRRIDAATGLIATIAGGGSGPQRYTPATNAMLVEPTAFGFDGALNLYVADFNDNSVREIWGAGIASPPAIAMMDATVYPLPATDVDAELPAFQVLVTENGAPVANLSVTWSALTTGMGLRSTATSTDASGIAARPGGRVARAPGVTNQLVASLSDIHGNAITGTEVTMSVTPVSPPSGTIFSLTDVYYAVQGVTPPPAGGIPGPATLASLAGSLPVEASDGTVYFIDQCAIATVSPAGVVSLFAGDPTSCGDSGDGGLASQAMFQPGGLALDASNHRLLLTNGSTSVRAIDLQSGLVTTLAGGPGVACTTAADCAGVPSAPVCGASGLCAACAQNSDCGTNGTCLVGTYDPEGVCLTSNGTAAYAPGDTGPATQAVLATPGSVVPGNGGFFFTDFYGTIVRFVSSSGTITTLPFGVYTGSSSCTSSGPLALGGISSLAWSNSAATLFAAASMCGGPVGGCNVDWAGIAQWTPASNQVGWTGGIGNGCTENVPAACNGFIATYEDGYPAQCSVLLSGSLAVGTDGLLYLSAIDGDWRVRRINADSTVTTIAGTYEMQGATGDYGPATSALLDFPQGLSFGSDGSLVVDDTDSGGKFMRLRYIQP